MLSRTRIATLFRRYPWLAKNIIRVYRISLPRYSAGVVGVLLDDQQRVLMVEHVFHPKYAWGLPGGWIGRAEEPAAALQREFVEEMGLAITVRRPLVVQRGFLWRDHLDIAFLITANGPLENIALSFELINYGWFKLDELPPLNPFHWQVLAVVKELLEKDALR